MFSSCWVKVGEINTHYLVGGEGQPLVLIHGGSATTAEEDWALNLEALAKHHKVYALDMVGYGKTDSPTIHYTQRLFNEFFNDFMAVLDIERASLMGHSMGGGIALSFTLNHPEKVTKLVLISTAGLSDQLGFVGRLIVPFLKVAARIKKNSTYLSLMNNGDSDEYEVYMDRLHEIAVPTAIFWGSWDGYLPVKLAYQAHERISNSELHIFKRGWHAPNKEKPAEFNRLVLDFLRK